MNYTNFRKHEGSNVKSFSSDTIKKIRKAFFDVIVELF